MKKLVIVHFQPIEKYPPAINLARQLASSHNAQIRLITTSYAGQTSFEDFPGVTITRIGTIVRDVGLIRRVLFYLKFNLFCFFILLRFRPLKILYYETFSAGAPCIYKLLFGKKIQLFIHYHEYTSPEEYNRGMILVKMLHRLERRVYKKANWISHTNTFRAELFLKDLGNPECLTIKIIPNFPPESWKRKEKSENDPLSNQLRFVYVGALDLETMYVKEFCEFILNNSNCRWDIYSDNYTIETSAYLKAMDNPRISFHGGVKYDQLPEILPPFDIGLILYRGHIPNYIYNAPNKLFEYLVCGLDVWFPADMLGTVSYVNTKEHPKIVPVLFKENCSVAFTGEAKIEPSMYTSEIANAELAATLLN